jgi:CheY-like chemotaxis protein
MEAVLRDLGVRVLTADGGEQALNLLEHEPSIWCSWIAICRRWTA